VLNCGQSDDVLNPLQGLIDPAYMVDLRLMLRLAIAKTQAARIGAIESQMHPRTREDVETLSRQLTEAVAELRQLRERLKE
jgi:hypothetical protein